MHCLPHESHTDMKTANLRIVFFVGALCTFTAKGQDAQGKPSTEKDFSAIREQALEKLRAEQRQKEESPEYIEEQSKLAEARAKAIQQMSKASLSIQARVLTVADGAVLAIIRVKKKLPPKSNKKGPQFSLSDELDDPFWIEGVDTRHVVDNDVLDLTVYSAGKKSYRAVSGAWKTVRRFATSPEQALNLALTQK